MEIYPTISIIMPVHNGGAWLVDKVKHLLSIDYPRELLEIIVISDGSTDGTNQVLTTVSEERFRTFIVPERRGKAAALNVGIREARGSILVFVDVRPFLERNAIRQLVRNFADPQIGCVGGDLVLCRNQHDAATGAVGDLYWRYEQWLRMLETRSGSLLGVYGGFYAARRELISELPEGTILDDMYQPLHIVRQGYRAVLDDRARVRDTWPNKSAGEFVRKVRTLAGNFQLLQLAPWLLLRQNPLRWRLVGHKLMRLAIPMLLIVLLLSSWMLRSSSLYLATLIVQIVFYLVGSTGLLFNSPAIRKICGPPAAFCLLNAASVVALWKFLFTSGPLWKIWEPQLTEVAWSAQQRARTNS